MTYRIAVEISLQKEPEARSRATRRTPHVSAVRFTHNPAFDDLIEATMFLTDIAGVQR